MTGCFVIWYPFVNAQNHAAANINHLYASTSTVVMIALIQNQLRNLRAALCPARKGCKVLIHIMIASTFIPLQTPSGVYVAAQRKKSVDLHFLQHRHKGGGASPLGVACAACFEQLACVSASCGALL